jgi:hypothetical protein
MAIAIDHVTRRVRWATKKFTHHSIKNILYDEKSKNKINFEITFYSLFHNSKMTDLSSSP